jgi:hypothetical protein
MIHIIAVIKFGPHKGKLINIIGYNHNKGMFQVEEEPTWIFPCGVAISKKSAVSIISSDDYQNLFKKFTIDQSPNAVDIRIKPFYITFTKK